MTDTLVAACRRIFGDGADAVMVVEASFIEFRVMPSELRYGLDPNLFRGCRLYFKHGGADVDANPRHRVVILVHNASGDFNENFICREFESEVEVRGVLDACFSIGEVRARVDSAYGESRRSVMHFLKNNTDEQINACVAAMAKSVRLNLTLFPEHRKCASKIGLDELKGLFKEGVNTAVARYTDDAFKIIALNGTVEGSWGRIEDRISRLFNHTQHTALQ